MIPYGRQSISSDDIAAVAKVLRSDFLTQGPDVPAFESAVASYCGVAEGVAVNSATSALHIACLALDVGPGDVVWTTPITFLASANCALYCGAAVDFVDIDPKTWTMSVEALAAKLEQADRDGRLPKVVIPVHLCGRSCDMTGIGLLGERYGFRIIEDASHAIGGSYRGHKIGSCRHSDIAVFSFHPVKIITSAEGGMAMTDDPGLANKMRRFRSHGMTREPSEMMFEADGPWYYEQVDLGFNYRLTDIQAALGASQLQKIDPWVARRHELAERYDTSFKGLPIKTPAPDPNGYSGLHLYVVLVEKPIPGRGEVFRRLRASGVGVNVHYIPLTHQPYYRALGHRAADFPNAESYYSSCISLPMFATLELADQDFVIAELREALE